MKIEHGWADFEFVLHDVKFNSAIELQQKDDDGDWNRRDTPPIHFDKEAIDNWEQEKNLRYSKNRTLKAVAKMPESIYRQMFIGVPDDKECIMPGKGHFEEMDFTLYDQPFSLKYGKGKVRCTKGDDEGTKKVRLECAIPLSAMDDVESWIDSGSKTFLITVLIKCWNFLGPIGDTRLYVEEEEINPVEIVAIHKWDDFLDQVEDEDTGPPDNNVSIDKRLS